MSKNRRPEECGLFPVVQLEKAKQANYEQDEEHPVVYACKYALRSTCEFIEYVFVKTVQAIFLAFLIAFFGGFAPVAVGVFIKYLGFFN